jgi:hypothetical protein
MCARSLRASAFVGLTRARRRPRRRKLKDFYEEADRRNSEAHENTESNVLQLEELLIDELDGDVYDWNWQLGTRRAQAAHR